MHRFRLFISHLIPNGMMPQLFHHRDQNGLGAAPGTSAQRPAWRLSLSVSLGRQRCPPAREHSWRGAQRRGTWLLETRVSALLGAGVPWRLRSQEVMAEGDFRETRTDGHPGRQASLCSAGAGPAGWSASTRKACRPGAGRCGRSGRSPLVGGAELGGCWAPTPALAPEAGREGESSGRRFSPRGDAGRCVCRDPEGAGF